MGTLYHITLQSNSTEIQPAIDQLLVEINEAVSTYDKSSLISLFNQDYDRFLVKYEENSKLSKYFKDNLALSFMINKETKGAFEPTIMPLVNYWGFGYDGHNKIEQIDSSEVRKRMLNVGLENIMIQDDQILKSKPEIQLDFSAVAKGYAADKIAEYLESIDIHNYYIEIGGDLIAKGVNAKGLTWRTGISVPSIDATVTDFQEIIEVSDKGVATSGNYRNYYRTSDGRMYSHTINPKTGYPEQNELLSATIIASTCAIADGFATAAMVFGVNGAKKMITLNPDLEGVLIYNDENGQFQVFDSNKIDK